MNKKKRAFLVVSSGNSGSRLMAGIFKQSGCWGDIAGHCDGWNSRLDKGIWPKKDVCNIFWRTHNNMNKEKVPPGRVGATSIYRMIDQCIERGYEPTILTIFRDIWTTSCGAVKAGYRANMKNHTRLSTSEEVRYQENEIQKLHLSFYTTTFKLFADLQNKGHQVFPVDIAALQRNPVLYIRMLATEIDFPLNDQVIIKRNADAKHYTRFNNKEELAVYRDEENKKDGT